MVKGSLEVGEEAFPAQDARDAQMVAETDHAFDHPINLDINLHFVEVHRLSDIGNDAAEGIFRPLSHVNSDHLCKIRLENTPRRTGVHNGIESRRLNVSTT